MHPFGCLQEEVAQLVRICVVEAIDQRSELGYAVGALLAGLLADLFGVPWAIAGIAALTFASGAVVLARMRETMQQKQQQQQP